MKDWIASQQLSIMGAWEFAFTGIVLFNLWSPGAEQLAWVMGVPPILLAFFGVVARRP